MNASRGWKLAWTAVLGCALVSPFCTSAPAQRGPGGIVVDGTWICQKDVDEVGEYYGMVVGINEYELNEPITIPLLRIDKEAERRHLDRLNRIRAERDNEQIESCLAKLRDAANGTENLMPLIIEAVREYATLGEVCDAFRDVFGVHQPVSRF